MPAIRRRGDPLQPVLRPEIPGFFADCLRKAFDDLVAVADSLQEAWAWKGYGRRHCDRQEKDNDQS